MMKKANTQYVLVKGFEVLGPFETLELAQLFRSEHRDTLNGYVAVRIRDTELWSEVLKRVAEAKQ